MIIKTGDECKIDSLLDDDLSEAKCSKCGKPLNTIKLDNGVEIICECEVEND